MRFAGIEEESRTCQRALPSSGLHLLVVFDPKAKICTGAEMGTGITPDEFIPLVPKEACQSQRENGHCPRSFDLNFQRK